MEIDNESEKHCCVFIKDDNLTSFTILVSSLFIVVLIVINVFIESNHIPWCEFILGRVCVVSVQQITRKRNESDAKRTGKLLLKCIWLTVPWKDTQLSQFQNIQQQTKLSHTYWFNIISTSLPIDLIVVLMVGARMNVEWAGETHQRQHYDSINQTEEEKLRTKTTRLECFVNDIHHLIVHWA